MEQRFCRSCGASLKERHKKLYCSVQCQKNFQYKVFIDEWLSGKRKVITENISRYIKKYLLEKNENKCSSCGWSKENPFTGRVPLEVDHLDGNADNNDVSNVRILCPNCHALTSSFRNLNKGSGRAWRRKYLKT